MTINPILKIKQICNQSNSYCVVLMTAILLMVIGLKFPFFSVISFGTVLLYIVATNNEYAVCMMFFLVSFANIYKFTPESTSFYTYLSLILVAKLLLTKRYINRNFIIVWGLLFSIQILGCNWNFTLLIKQAMILMLIYGYFNSCDKITEQITLNMAIGLICSCTLGIFADMIPGLSQYMRIVRAYEISIDVYRFTGLYTDPNYLTQNLIITCMSIIVLINQNKLRKKYFMLCVILIYFGILTISKSFLLMLAIGVIIYYAISIKEKKYLKSMLLIICASIFGICILTGKITIFDDVISRLLSSDDITTGRVDIWKNYVEYLLAHPVKLIIGNGIGTSALNYLAHNTYLDFLYYYGIVGTIVFIMGVKYAIGYKEKKKTITNLAPLICFSILSFCLSNIQMYDFVYIIIFVFDHIIERKEKHRF